MTSVVGSKHVSRVSVGFIENRKGLIKRGYTILFKNVHNYINKVNNITSFVAGLCTSIQSFVFDSTNFPSMYIGTFGMTLHDALNRIAC